MSDFYLMLFKLSRLHDIVIEDMTRMLSESVGLILAWD